MSKKITGKAIVKLVQSGDQITVRSQADDYSSLLHMVYDNSFIYFYLNHYEATWWSTQGENYIIF